MRGRSGWVGLCMFVCKYVMYVCMYVCIDRR